MNGEDREPGIGPPSKKRALFVVSSSVLLGEDEELVGLLGWLQRHGWDLAVASNEATPALARLRQTSAARVVIEPALLIDPARVTLRELASEADIVVAHGCAAEPAIPASQAEKVAVVWNLFDLKLGTEITRSPARFPSLTAATALLVPTKAIAAAMQTATPVTVHTLPLAISRGRQPVETYAEELASILETTIRQGLPLASRDAYTEWVELYETMGPADRAELKQQLSLLGEGPLISILLWIHNPDAVLVRQTIESVKTQIYDRWELCIAVEESLDPALLLSLQSEAERDPRIRLSVDPARPSTETGANSSLQLATGQWCVCLKQHDVLAEHALAVFAVEFVRFNTAGLAYSDEDCIDMRHTRSGPRFKPDWSPELLRSYNYIGNGVLYQTSLLRELKGFREEFGPVQVYDLLLRVLEHLQSEDVRHIPRVLYHERKPALKEQATADDGASRAISDHLSRLGIPGRVTTCPGNQGLRRALYETPTPEPLVSIIVNCNSPVQRLCDWMTKIKSMTRYSNYEVIVTLDHSQSTVADIARLTESGARVVETGPPYNPGQWNNRAASASAAEVLVFMAVDLKPKGVDWLDELIANAVRPEVGVVGPAYWNIDGSLRDGGLILGLGGSAGPASSFARGLHPGVAPGSAARNCSAVSMACLVVRSGLFRELSGFEEKNLTNHLQDADFCLRARERGLHVIWTPHVELIDGRSLSREKETSFLADEAYFMNRWANEIRHDPFYNPNLSLTPPGFELSFPPRAFSELRQQATKAS